MEMENRCACNVIHEQALALRAEVIRELRAKGENVGPPFDIPGGKTYLWSRTLTSLELDACLNWQEVIGAANTLEHAAVDGVKVMPKPFFAHPFEENRVAVTAGYVVFRLIAPVERCFRRGYLAIARRWRAKR